MSKFQVILTTLFGVFLLVGVFVFSIYRGSSNKQVTVTMWGSLSNSEFQQIISETELASSDLVKVDYREIAESEFDSIFIEALASGQGPDMFLLPSDKIVKHKNKILELPFSVFTERQFKDSFIEGSEIYLTPNGTLALPISVDPLVMYWNRTILTNSKITEPPKYWDQFFALANQVSIKDGSLNIIRSLAALGEYNNISHAKEIISTLVMQAGSPITIWYGDRIGSQFLENPKARPTIPAEAAVNFYTEFSNPAKSAYSWNRSLPNSYNYFLGGDLALYFGLASEIASIQTKNPNLNFDVATIPTSREGGDNVSFGKFYGLAITKASKNPNSAFSVASVLTGKVLAKRWSEVVGMPPVRRDLLSTRQTAAHLSVFYDSAIRSKAWFDPDPVATDAVLRSAIESITSGRSRISEALSRANRELEALLAR